MTHDEAVKILNESKSPTSLAEAIGVLVSDENSSLNEIVLGLNHRGCIAEQAAISLYLRTKRPIPDDHSTFELNPIVWRRWIDKARSWNHPSERTGLAG